jgi:hypothetical protein
MTRRSRVELVRVGHGASGRSADVAVRFDDPVGEALADVAELVAEVAPSPPSLSEVLALPSDRNPDLIPIDLDAFTRVVLRGAGRVFRWAPSAGGRSAGGDLLLRARRGAGGEEPPIEALFRGVPPPEDDSVRLLVSSGRRSLVVLQAALRRRGDRCEVWPLAARLFRRRSGDRVRIRPEDAVRLRWVHPLIAGRVIERPPFEIGEGGLSFDGDLRTDVLSTGMLLSGVRLEVAGGGPIRLVLSVRSVRPSARGGHRFGLRVEADDPVGSWDTFVLRRLMPRVAPLEPGETAEVWSLFDRTGYLDEKPRERMVPLGRAFASAWERLSTGDVRLGSALLLRDEASLRGAVFRTQAYPGTYLLHQLALDLRSPERDVPKPAIAGQIYRSLFHLCARAPDLRHTLAVFNDEKSWSGYLYDEFFALPGNRKRYSVERLRLVEKPLGREPPPPPSSPWSIRPFAESDRGWVEAAVAESFPPLAARALALAPLDADLGGLGADFRAAGLERTRAVWIVERGGRPAGVGVVERATPGINIFGLLDAVLPFALPGVPDDSAWLAVLLSEVERRRHGTAESVSALCPASWPESWTPEGYRTVAVVRRWIAERALLPSYLAYLDEHFGAAGQGTEEVDA